MTKTVEMPQAADQKKKNERTGECAFCGQQRLTGMKMAEWDALEEQAAGFGMTVEDFAATMKCQCRNGEQMRNSIMILQKAKENIEMMFRGELEVVADIFQDTAASIYAKDIKKIVIQDYKGGKATMSLQKGLIRLEYEQKKKTELTSE